MFSIKPDDGGGQIDAGEKAYRPFVIAGGDATIVFEPTEEVLDVSM